MNLRRLVAATFLASLGAVVAASPVEAGARYRGHDGHSRPRLESRRPVTHRHVVVPSRIDRRDARHHRRYYDRRVWFGPHRHHHAVYLFPVFVRPGVIAHAPHTYCDGRLTVRGDVVLDRHARHDRDGGYDDPARYRWDDRLSGYVAIGGPGFRIGLGF